VQVGYSSPVVPAEGYFLLKLVPGRADKRKHATAV
jgi:hypothetical protein